MRRTAWIGLVIVGTGVAFGVGLTLGRSRKSEAPPPRLGAQAREEATVPNADGDLLTKLDQLRLALAERDDQIASLEAELRDMGEELAAVSAEDEEPEPEIDEAQRALEQKWKEMRKNLLQRKDKGLRAQAIEELAVLLETQNQQDLLLWLPLVSDLAKLDCDKRKLKPAVLAAIWHSDAEVRAEAFDSLSVVCPPDELSVTLLELANDSSSEIRSKVAGTVGQSESLMVKKELVGVLHTLLEDDDEDVRMAAAQALWRNPEYAEDMEEFAIQLSQDPQKADEARRLLLGAPRITRDMAQRLVELGRESNEARPFLHWGHLPLTDDAKPIAATYLVRVVREGVEYYQRYFALTSLQKLGDPSVISDLQAIAQSENAEGIEAELARTIEYLRNPPKRAR